MVRVVKLDYNDALRYFELDIRMKEFLNKLTDREKEEFVMYLIIDDENKTAVYRFGNMYRDSEHLFQIGNGIDNTMDYEDDYDGVIEFLRERK